MTHPNGTIDRPEVGESNGLINGLTYHRHHHAAPRYAGRVCWTDPQLDKVTRLRLVSDPGFPFWDVSYCHGVLKDGRTVDVEVPFHQLPKRGMMRAIVQAAIEDGVHARRLGVLDNISTLC